MHKFDHRLKTCEQLLADDRDRYKMESIRLRTELICIRDRLESAVRDGDSTRVVRALEVARAALKVS